MNYFSNKIEGSILTSEKTLNYNKIYQNIYQKIKVRKNIILKKKTIFAKEDLKFDKIIICTYKIIILILNSRWFKIFTIFKKSKIYKIILCS